MPPGTRPYCPLLPLSDKKPGYFLDLILTFPGMEYEKSLINQLRLEDKQPTRHACFHARYANERIQKKFHKFPEFSNFFLVKMKGNARICLPTVSSQARHFLNREGIIQCLLWNPGAPGAASFLSPPAPGHHSRGDRGTFSDTRPPILCVPRLTISL